MVPDFTARGAANCDLRLRRNWTNPRPAVTLSRSWGSANNERGVSLRRYKRSGRRADKCDHRSKDQWGPRAGIGAECSDD